WGDVCSSISAVEFGAAGSVRSSASALGSTGIINNSYYDGTNNRAIVTGASSVCDLGAAHHYWYTAPSVAAGAVQTFVQRMSIGTTGTLTLSPDAGVSALNA